MDNLLFLVRAFNYDITKSGLATGLSLVMIIVGIAILFLTSKYIYEEDALGFLCIIVGFSLSIIGCIWFFQSLIG